MPSVEGRKRQRRMVPVRPLLDAVFDAQRPQPGAPSVGVVGLVGIDRFLVAHDQGIAHHRVVHLRPGEKLAADQAAAVIDGCARAAAANNNINTATIAMTFRMTRPPRKKGTSAPSNPGVKKR